MVVGNNESTKMQANHWQFRLLCRCGGTTRDTLPMEHIQGFTWSRWMQPLGKCPSSIAPAAAMANKFEGNTQNTTFSLQLWYILIASCFMRISYPKMDPLFSSLMRPVLLNCETPQFEQKSLWTFLAIKRCQGTKRKKKLSGYEACQKAGAYVCH